MKRYLFILLCTCGLSGMAQDTLHRKFGVEYRLDAIRYKGDSLNSADTMIRLSFDRVSEIVPLCTTPKRMYGIQFEVMESKLNNGVQYYVRIAYYYRDANEWILIYSSDPSPRNLLEKIVHKEDSGKNRYYNPTKEFDVYFFDLFYLI